MAILPLMTKCSMALLYGLVVISNSAEAFAVRQQGPYPRRASSHYHHQMSRSKDLSKCVFPVDTAISSHTLHISSSALYVASSKDDDASLSDDEDDDSSTSTSKLTFRERWAKAFPKKEEEGEKLPLRQRLAKMGLACVLSYGFVSNLNAGITTGVAWFLFSKKTGLSPLAPGQWPKFLGVYAGLWVVNNFIRPVRVAAAVAICPQFDNIVSGFQNRLKVNKAVAVGITVFMANIVVTTLLTGLGIVSAATLSGVSIFPPKP
eukprot:scaffold3591_cov159-Amphora_coffeaeformis.AAC.10